MQITIFSDLHGKLDKLEEINNDKKSFFLGDIYSNKEFIQLIGIDFMQFYLKKIDRNELAAKFSLVKEKLEKSNMNEEIPAFFKRNKLFVLPGNHETKNYYKKMINLPNITNLHLKKTIIEEKEFVGCGGMFSPDKRIQSENFFIFPDEEIAKKLENLNASKNCIILMHELPIADYCKKTREVIEKIQPQIVIAGHNHQIAKKEFIINGIKYLASSMKGESIQINI